MVSKEKDKTLEDFMEELLMVIWAVIHFSIMPVKSKSEILAVFENLARSLVLYGWLIGCLWLYCFAHERMSLFNNWNLFYFFSASALYFTLRHLYYSWSF